MQLIVFKREFFVLFDTIKTENVQHLEKKIKPIKKIVIKKIQKKLLKICFLRHSDRFLKKIS